MKALMTNYLKSVAELCMELEIRFVYYRAPIKPIRDNQKSEKTYRMKKEQASANPYLSGKGVSNSDLRGNIHLGFSAYDLKKKSIVDLKDKINEKKQPQFKAYVFNEFMPTGERGFQVSPIAEVRADNVLTNIVPNPMKTKISFLEIHYHYSLIDEREDCSYELLPATARKKMQIFRERFLRLTDIFFENGSEKMTFSKVQDIEKNSGVYKNRQIKKQGLFYKQEEGSKRKKHVKKYVSSDTRKKDYMKNVRQAVDLIRKNQFRKVVLSRVRAKSFKKNAEKEEQTIRAFVVALGKYPKALVSLISTETSGTWFTATPELLASYGHMGEKDNKKGCFKAFSLAGTKTLEQAKEETGKRVITIEDVLWSTKEIREQALVSRYIVDTFKVLRLRNYVEEGPFTINSGNLFHLCSIFSVDDELGGDSTLSLQVLSILHPTSAVGGVPKKEALKFVDKVERHNREYFAGFQGPIGLNLTNTPSFQLYVNLRTLKLEDKKVRFFAGAGIVENSNPVFEWYECENKISTLGALF